MVDKKLCEMVNLAIDDELKAIFEYDEILELMHEDSGSHVKHTDTIIAIMRQEASHMVEFRKIAMDMGCGETKVWQDIEDMLGIIEDKYGILEDKK